MTPSHELWPVVNLTDFGSWDQGSRCYEQVRDVVDMNDSRL